MVSHPTVEDPTVLETLREHEVVLERRLDEARRDAHERRARADTDAERLRGEANAALAQELERMRTEHTRALEAITREARESGDRTRRDLELRFVERREGAVSLVLGLLTATESP